MSEEQDVHLHNRMLIWNRLKKNLPARIAIGILAGLVLLAVLAPWLATDLPWYARYRGENLFPAFTCKKFYEINNGDGSTEHIQVDITDWKHLPLEKAVWAPVPYDPAKSDLLNANFISPGGDQKYLDSSRNQVSMPLRFRHLLGTGARGNDVLSGLIHGTSISISIGFLSMGIAALIGIIIGALAGFFGDDRLRVTRIRFWMILAGILTGWFYAFEVRGVVLGEALNHSDLQFAGELLLSIFIFALAILIFSFLGKWMERLFRVEKIIHVPLDSILSRITEIFVSLPLFMLILTIAALSRPSLIHVMIIIGFTSWTGIARLTRAGMLRVRRLDYIRSAEALGLGQARIMFRHALPNVIAPVLVAVTFGIASAILTESSLSFIGIGVPPDLVTWGSLLNSGRENFHAWWIVVFPGVMIFITVTCYNLIGESLRDAIDSSLKS